MFALLGNVLADDYEGHCQSADEKKEEGVAEAFLQQVEVVLRGDAGEEDVVAIGDDLGG